MKIQISHIRKSYRHKEVLKDITFSASSGTAIGILGENGCGKSTLLGILAGALKADEGEFLLERRSLRNCLSKTTCACGTLAAVTPFRRS